MIWIILAVIALIIAKYLADDYTEEDAVDEAEWIISDYCTEARTCKECKKFVEKVGHCKYRFLSPARWKEGVQDGISGKGCTVEEVQGSNEDCEILSGGSGPIQGDESSGEESTNN